MKAYSEIIASFRRGGPFPLELDYIFETEDKLKEFYANPVENAILHKGLLKIVEDDGEGNQALYWVTRKQTNNELEFTKLVTSSSGEQLGDLLTRLEKEIQDRIDGDDALWGMRDHTSIPEDLNSIKDLSDAIIAIREKIADLEETDANWDESLKAIIGTDEEDYIAYLATLDYPSLTALSTNLHKFLEEVDAADTKINTLPELQAFLEGYTDKDKLATLLQELHDGLWGDPFPTEPFRTLRGIEDFVRTLKSESENVDANLQTELDQTQVGVGLSGDGSYNPDKETHYLKDATSVMNALKIIDSLINEAINNVNIQVADTSSIDMTIDKQVDKTILSADVRISTVDGNGVAIKNDGLFYKLTTEYEDGILTIKVNDKIINQHVIGLSSVVEDARYDPTTEEIVIVFKLLTGDKQTLRIPVGTLIREWEIDNSYPDKVVVLEKTETLGGGTDKLSADVRLYVDKYNILVKQGNTLYVRGTTDNITHKDTALETVIDNMQAQETATQTALDAEIGRAKASEQKLATDLTAETTRATGAEAQLRNDLTAEVTRATTAEKSLSDRIDTLDTGSATEIAALKIKVDNEIKRSTDKDNEHDLAIATEVSRAETVEKAITSALDTEIIRAKTEEAAIQRDVLANKTAIDAEIIRATAAEKNNADNLAAEITRSADKDAALAISISDETARAIAEEKQIVASVTAETTRAKGEESRIETKAENLVKTEETRAIAAEKVNTDAIAAEIVRAKTEEKVIADSVTAETARATKAEEINAANITVNANAITAETNRAKAAEAALDAKIGASETATTLIGEDTYSVDLTVTKDAGGTKLKADVIVSDQAGNIIKKLNSGLYASATIDYNAATNVITFDNGVVVKDVQLSAGSIIDSLRYDKATESLILTYTDAKGSKKEVSVPMTDLIVEWDVANSDDNPIKLTKSPHSISGTDTLSASINVDQNATSLLRVKAGFLTASNNSIDIIYKDAISVYKAITDEIARATAKENATDTTLAAHTSNTTNPHNVTKAQVGLGNVQDIAPADLPISTLQQAKFTAIDVLVATKASQNDLTAHTGNHANPHAVTKAQVGLEFADNTSDINKPISAATQTALNAKASLKSPIFEGSPTTPTPDSGDKSLRIANTLWVERTIGELIWGNYD